MEVEGASGDIQVQVSQAQSEVLGLELPDCARPVLAHDRAEQPSQPLPPVYPSMRRHVGVESASCLPLERPAVASETYFLKSSVSSSMRELTRNPSQPEHLFRIAIPRWHLLALSVRVRFSR